MNKSNQREQKHPMIIKKRIEQASHILQKLNYELNLSSRVYSESKSLIHRYFSDFPDTAIKLKTIVGSIIYLVSLSTNEHISLQTIADHVQVSLSWLSKKKKRIASDLGWRTP